MKNAVVTVFSLIQPLTAVFGGESADGHERSSVRSVDCDFESGAVNVTCGELDVWENREKASGRRIPIHFVLARSTGEQPAPDPLVILLGGPGQHASTGAARQLRQLSSKL